MIGRGLAAVAAVMAAVAVTSTSRAEEAATEGARTTELAAVTFAPPERLTSGDAFVGHRRLYPSPVLFDLEDRKSVV